MELAMIVRSFSPFFVNLCVAYVYFDSVKYFNDSLANIIYTLIVHKLKNILQIALNAFYPLKNLFIFTSHHHTAQSAIGRSQLASHRFSC